MIYKDLEQRSEEWFTLRLGKLTGSRLGDIMPGVKGKYLASRENYLDELVAEILTGETATFFVNDAMQHGIDSEPLAMSEYEAREEVFVLEVGLCTHPTIEGFQASPDGLVEGEGCIEIKCPNTATHLKVMSTGKINRKYEWQMYAEMMCAERKWCDYVDYDPRLPSTSSYFIKRYELTEEIRENIEQEVIKFLAELKTKVDQIKGE